MAFCDVYVVGMRKEYFVDFGPADSSFDEEEITNTRYILFCKASEGRKNVNFTITLTDLYGWCGSGYTTASWGRMDIQLVKDFGPATHIPKDHRPIKLENVKYDMSSMSSSTFSKRLFFNTLEENNDDDIWEYDIETNLFSYSDDGGDSYYPNGGISIHEELFIELPRSFKERPVWIFTGASGTGKSTLGYYLKTEERRVYETDSANNGVLPKEIWADIIVVGNKWKNISVDSVLQHLPKDTKPVIANFSM